MKGSTVTVVRGRKVPVGTMGVVVWEGEGRSFAPAPRYYRNGWTPAPPPMRVGIKTAEGVMHYTAASNVEVTAAAPEAAPFVPVPGFTKGVKVMTPHGPGKVFWVGPCKRNPGGTRVGVKVGGESMFLGSEECELPGGPPMARPALTAAPAAPEAVEAPVTPPARASAPVAVLSPGPVKLVGHAPSAPPVTSSGAAAAWARAS